MIALSAAEVLAGANVALAISHVLDAINAAILINIFWYVHDQSSGILQICILTLISVFANRNHFLAAFILSTRFG